MAGKSRAGRYKMTAKRKASLRKAQLASARKRSRNRKRVARNVGLGAGILALSAGGYLAHRKLTAKRAIGVDNGPKALNRHWKRTDLDELRRQKAPEKRGKKPKTWRSYSKSGKAKIMSVSPSGVVTITRFNSENSKKRKEYNDKRRKAYWSGRASVLQGYYPNRKPKKVGGTPRKNAKKTPQQKAIEKAQNNQIVSLFVARQSRQSSSSVENVSNIRSLDFHRKNKGKKK